MSIGWIIALSVYAFIMTALTVALFVHPMTKGHRGPLEIFIVWVVILIFGPFFMLYGFIRSLIK